MIKVEIGQCLIPELCRKKDITINELCFKGEKLDITISVTPQSLVKLRDDINELIFMFSD